MAGTEEDDGDTKRALLGVCVLLLTVLLSNLCSISFQPGEAFQDQLAIPLVRRLSAVGFFGQLGAGIWLAVALIFDSRRGTRLAFAAWLVAVCLYSAPVPRLAADLALAPALLVCAFLLAALTRALDRATRAYAA